MGSGGVAIAALPTVICLKVPFSDGLGGADNYNSFFLMSDGAADCLYHKKQRIFAPAIRSFSSWIEKYDEESVNLALLENMTKIFPKHTTDDCSFIMCKNMSLYKNNFITDEY